jgi:hypothetical protein
MSRGVVLSLCDLTGNMVKPWAEAGYECLIVDIQHPVSPGDINRDWPNISRINGDLRSWAPWNYRPRMVFAFPPCTHLASSGARWFADKGLSPLIESLILVNRCREIAEQSGAPWMIENPVGRLATCWRKPDHTFDPCEYGGYLDPPGDAYTKRTCLWVGGGFVMPAPRPVPPAEGSRMHRIPPGPDRANLRSKTPRGFARAVFEANAK